MKNCGLWVLLFVAGAAQAQPVYKCTAEDGSNSYQSTPCAEGEASATRSHVAPSSGSAPLGSAPLSSSMQAVAVPAGPGQRRVQVRYTTNAANSACDGAKAQRTAALGAAGAAVSPALRNSLDQDVRNACG
ncbi:DUF4124 domain-containing protein [Pseudoxanthomonas daejeonensis]|uniref:DUF4124 domain-containing protein n=1 Tax=Pseudoxanthomonas daejeonensis TaxID=266062 RepID=A0ABQ6Z7P1_9GAMM|nr:DUF4124 domain-containing protein [Pseudoxanthomonas daejeonensis]KAF1694800.1 hypothetical protein CSC65_08915 [Pseudoxanthomonas daejeonensis]UNK56634.1 DUF4124 domain-containing protein [Pseudoxanthomonas daejeonensis]